MHKKEFAMNAPTNTLRRIAYIGLGLSIGLAAGAAMFAGGKPAQSHYPCSPPAGYYVAPTPVYGPAGVRGEARRVSRRTSRRVSRRY